MYADDSTIYASATTANEVTETLNKELHSVLDWVASVLIIKYCIVFGTNNFLSFS